MLRWNREYGILYSFTFSNKHIRVECQFDKETQHYVGVCVCVFEDLQGGTD